MRQADATRNMNLNLRLDCVRGLFLLSLVGVMGVGCSCRPPPAQLEDGGTLLNPECAVEADCPLG